MPESKKFAIRKSQLKKALYVYYTLSNDNLHFLGYYRNGVGSKKSCQV